jgi:hypothetical protein
LAVLDLPDSVALVSVEHPAWWNQTPENVLGEAFRNSSNEPTHVEVRDFGPVSLVLVHGTHMYTSAHAVMPERHLPNLGPAGAIVSLPCRDVVFSIG